METKRKLRVACLQINASSDWQKNFRSVSKKIALAAHRGAKWIALPENFLWRGAQQGSLEIARTVTPFVLTEFKALAREKRIAILLGSLPVKAGASKKICSTSFLISPDGRIAARYQKIHLFDVSLKNVRVKESDGMIPGKRIVRAKIAGIPVGLTLCYDLRFPELFRRLARRGSRIIFVPSNFTYTTGQAHWEVLLRARAIENQVFILAPDQVGANPVTKLRSFGTSLIVDPWGRVLRRGSADREEILLAELDLDSQIHLRKSFPVLKHIRLSAI